MSRYRFFRQNVERFLGLLGRLGQVSFFLLVLVVVVIAACIPGAGGGADLRSVRVAGYSVEYAIALPEDFDPGKEYPGYLVCPLGFPTPSNASKTIEVYWKDRARELGIVAIAPVGPRVHIFRDDKFERADEYFGPFLDEIVARYSIRDGKLVVVGAAHNGFFSLRLAASSPARIRRVIDMPAFAPDPELTADVFRKLGVPVVLVISADDKYIHSDETTLELEERGAIELIRIQAPPILEDGGYAAALDLILETGLIK